MFKTFKWQSMMIALIYIAGGVGLLFFTQTIEHMLVDLIGIALIVIGMLHIIGYLLMDIVSAVYRNDLINGIVLMLVGGLVIYQKKTFQEMVPLILALMVIVSGVFKIQDGIDTHRMGYSFGIAYGLAVISIGIGALIMFNVIKEPDIVTKVLGGGLLYSGVTDLFDSLFVSGKLRRYIKEQEASKVKAEEVNKPRPEKKEEPYIPPVLTPEEKEIKLEKPAMTIPSYDEVADSNIELTLDSEPAETEQTDNVQ
ncbi:MAG: DUF308 domain-containing protein [Solobacterium sp.]|nr:DUF308 domain-containing protein [Solobacterium sp.]